MSLLRSWLTSLPGYLWSGWGALASLFLLLAAWEAVASHYGALVLPAPLETFSRLLQLIDEGAAWPELLATSRRALLGFALSVAVGSVLGLAAVSP
jgi:NitT/TauT family transport system permease protein